MGVTSKDIEILNRILAVHDIKSVIELGAQNNYSGPNVPAPYMREWWEAKDVQYYSIDLNGECGAMKRNLAYPYSFREDVIKSIGIDEFSDDRYTFDLVTDFGTSEHIGILGQFEWSAIYNCWETKFDLCKLGGLIISENPKTGNWPGHGFQYYTEDFYVGLSKISDLDIDEIHEICAMGNCTTGKNIFCVMEKTGDKFPTLDEFKTLDLRFS